MRTRLRTSADRREFRSRCSSQEGIGEFSEQLKARDDMAETQTVNFVRYTLVVEVVLAVAFGTLYAALQLRFAALTYSQQMVYIVFAEEIAALNKVNFIYADPVKLMTELRNLSY